MTESNVGSVVPMGDLEILDEKRRKSRIRRNQRIYWSLFAVFCAASVGFVHFWPNFSESTRAHLALAFEVLFWIMCSSAIIWGIIVGSIWDLLS